MCFLVCLFFFYHERRNWQNVGYFFKLSSGATLGISQSSVELPLEENIDEGGQNHLDPLQYFKLKQSLTYFCGVFSIYPAWYSPKVPGSVVWFLKLIWGNSQS